jgi:hypothetical protein
MGAELPLASQTRLKLTRCPQLNGRLVPATGYYEWQTFADGKKVPHFVHDPAGEQLVFAGLYSWWKNHALPDDHPDLWRPSVVSTGLYSCPHPDHSDNTRSARSMRADVYSAASRST